MSMSLAWGQASLTGWRNCAARAASAVRWSRSMSPRRRLSNHARGSHGPGACGTISGWRWPGGCATRQPIFAADDLQANEDLAGELACVKYGLDSDGHLVVEPKDAMKKRLGHSPDLADGLGCTFAPGAPTWGAIDLRTALQGMEKPAPFRGGTAGTRPAPGQPKVGGRGGRVLMAHHPNDQPVVIWPQPQTITIAQLHTLLNALGDCIARATAAHCTPAQAEAVLAAVTAEVQTLLRRVTRPTP